jgi:hypothetical protein
MEYVPKKLVYVAGPIRAKTTWDVTLNIRRAEEIATRMWREGVVAFCPHSHLMVSQDAITDEEWIAGDLELVRRCDAIYMLPGWQDSDGSRDEYVCATRHGLTILQSWEDYERWRDGERSEQPVRAEGPDSNIQERGNT